jgi:hypothetical protein
MATPKNATGAAMLTEPTSTQREAFRLLGIPGTAHREVARTPPRRPAKLSCSTIAVRLSIPPGAGFTPVIPGRDGQTAFGRSASRADPVASGPGAALLTGAFTREPTAVAPAETSPPR